MNLSPEVLLGVMMAVVIAGLLLGQWTAMALGIGGVLGLALSRGTLGIQAISSIVWNNLNSFVLVAVPLFVLMGEVILRCGAGSRFYLGVAALMGRSRGPLLHANTVSCAIFSAVSGSSVATALAIGTLAVPEMLKQGYQPRIVFGSLAAGGTLGILIPPSLSMVIYGALVQESVSKLFIAGIIPGVVLAGIFLVYGIVRVRLDPSIAPAPSDRLSRAERLQQAAHVAPMVGTLVIVLGSIYAGIATPTEAAALGCLCSFGLAAGYRTLSWDMVADALRATVRVTCMVAAILIGAQIMAAALTFSGATREVTSWIVGLGLSKWEFFAALVALYVVLGTMVDGVSMIYLTLPVLYPAVLRMGFDPIWFGVVLTVLIEVGQIHPPVGLNLFAVHSIAQGHRFSDVALGAAPYVALVMMMLVLLAVWPGMATWLPTVLR